MEEIIYLTKIGHKELIEELDFKKRIERRDISGRISEARDKGDLSENAEYHAAKDEQGMLEMQISKLEGILANARIIDESKLTKDTVTLTCKVKVKNLKMNKVFTYIIVSGREANFKEAKISSQSAIGAALMGFKVGDTVDAKLPAGVIKLEILDIS